VLQTVDPATLTALHVNPNNRLAQAKAVSELSGVPVAEVAKAAALGAAYAQQLATAAALSPATQAALTTNPASAVAQLAAVGELARTLHIPTAAAIARLQALAAVPPADLAFLRSTGPEVRAGAARLQSVSAIPPAELTYLQAHATNVATAKQNTPGQWQTWWWVCFAGQLLFIPLALLLTGRWSPRRARADELEHEQLVRRELEALQPPRDLAPGLAPVAS
jgi:hypothetical protein